MGQKLNPGQIPAQPSAIMLSVPGRPVADQVFARFVLPFDLTPVLASCGGTQKTAGTISYVVTMKRADDTVVATWTWGAGATAPVVSLKVGVVPAGSYRIYGQTVVEGAPEELSVTLGGTR